VAREVQLRPFRGSSRTVFEVTSALISDEDSSTVGAAALVHVVRYALLLINRTVLLNPVVAWLATWLGVAVSVLAVFAVLTCVIVLTNWLIARRSAAFAHRGLADPRPPWMLRAGSWVPLVNLLWAPVFVIELATVENRMSQLRRPIVPWWIAWFFSTVLSTFSIATSFTSDAQGIADNTVTTIVAYLLALATVLLAGQVVRGFERTPVERVTRRWVVVAELVGATGGVGYELLMQQQQFDMAGALAWTLQLVFFVLISQQVIALIEAYAFRYRAASERAL